MLVNICSNYSGLGLCQPFLSCSILFFCRINYKESMKIANRGKVVFLSSLFCPFWSPKIAYAKTYTYPRIQLLPYVIRICILHISLRVYSLDSGADNSNYHLDKIVSNLQVLVIKTGKFTKTMSIGLLQMLFGYSFVSSTYLFCPLIANCRF